VGRIRHMPARLASCSGGRRVGGTHLWSCPGASRDRASLELGAW
jgi:hypothetical protein